MSDAHKARVTYTDDGRRLNWAVHCSCGWGSVFHDSEQQAIDAHGDHVLAASRD